MEEKKHYKPFSLDLYKKGLTKVRTREGKEVRILCTDAPSKEWPVIGIIKGETGAEMWRANGYFANDAEETPYDLVIEETMEEPPYVPVWKKASKGMNLGEDSVILYEGEEARLGRVAINDCAYIHVSELKKLPHHE